MKLTTSRVVKTAILAALYTIFTIGIAPLSYGPIQLRVAEFLKIIVLFDPVLALGIGIGTFFANLASPFVGPWELIWMPLTDMLGGVVAWFIYTHILRKHLPVIPAVIYAITTGLAVGTMLTILGLGGFWLLSLSVIASELILLIAGVPVVFGIERILNKRNLSLGENKRG